MNQKIQFCKVCQKNTTHIGPKTSHLLHLILSLITAGFWLPIWLIISANNNNQGQCTVCGRTTGLFGSGNGGIRPENLATPNTHVKCPDCRELIYKDAKKCRYCGCPLKPQ